MRLVPDDGKVEHRVACYELADGTLGALEYHAFEAFRAGLAEEARAAMHVVWIPCKMGLGRKAAVQNELRITTGKWGTALGLLQHNILAWEGPAFAGEEPGRAAIARLDEDEPLVGFVLDEITRRNPPRTAPDPKRPGAPGSRSAGAPSSAGPPTPVSPPASPLASTTSP